MKLNISLSIDIKAILVSINLITITLNLLNIK